MAGMMHKRLEAKTPEQRFLRSLTDEFQYAPKVAEAILQEAQDCLFGKPDQLRPGQVRVILTCYQAGPGQPLRHTPTKEVTWTVDAGLEDRQLAQQHGGRALRQVRIQRLLGEALDQGAVASQEDLAQALHVSLRTIKRDFVALHRQGIYLPTRGYVHGIGRGQTHKAQIVGHWLRGATYDQIARQTRHTLSTIQRYIQAFVRVIDLHQQGFTDNQIALLLQMGVALVREYLAVYQHETGPDCRERLATQLERLERAGVTPKRGQP